MNKYSRFLAVILCTVLMTVALPGVAFATGVTLTLQSAGNDLPTGAQLLLSASCSGGDTVEFYEKTAEGDVLIESRDVSDTLVYVTVGETQRQIYAVLKDVGSVVSQSETVTIPGGYRLRETASIFDFDFEDEVVTEPNDGKWVYVGGANSNLVGNTGSSVNAIVIDETVSEVIPDNPYGKALHVDANGVGQVQLNQIKVNYSGSGVVKFDFDFYTNFYSDSFHFFTAYATSSDGQNVNTSLVFDRGSVMFGGKKIEVGSDPKWTHFTYLYDLGADQATLMVNGQFANVVNIGKDIVRLDRMYMSLSPNHTGDVWIDNFKVYSAERLPNIKSAIYEGNKITAFLNKNISLSDITDVSVSFGKEKLIVTDFGYTTDDTTFDITLLQDVYTAVPLDIAITYQLTDGTETARYTLNTKREEFDVLSVAPVYEDGKIGAVATLANDTVEAYGATMILALLDEDGKVVNVAVSDTFPFIGIETVIDITPVETDAKYAEIFFINDFKHCTPVKNTVYRYEINN